MSNETDFERLNREHAELHEREKKRKKQKQADQLIDMAKAASLFHAPDGAGFADIETKGTPRDLADTVKRVQAVANP
jgi:hypothetical protein